MNELRWHKTTIKDFDYRKLPVTSINPINDEDRALYNNIAALLTSGEYKEGFLTSEKKGGILKRVPNFVGNRYYWYQLATDNYYVYIHNNEKGWAKIHITNPGLKQQDTSSFVHPFRELKKLIEEVPAVKNWQSTDVELNNQVHKAAQAFYITKGDYGPGKGVSFMGIPDEAAHLNGQTLDHVWSLDFHKAFPTMLSLVVPETKPWRDAIIKGEKSKAIGVQVIGAMTSEALANHGFAAPRCYAALRYEVLKKLSEMLNNIANKLTYYGATILNYRTDSIKFIWNKPYSPSIVLKDTSEGELWDFEWKNVQYRQFSTSKYEWREGPHAPAHIVLSGKTKLDHVKPRELWSWDDLLNPSTEELKWIFNKNTLQLQIVEVNNN